jgi:hypothetical protein
VMTRLFRARNQLKDNLENKEPAKGHYNGWFRISPQRVCRSIE